MKTPQTDLQMAALAAAALPHTDFAGTCAPRYRDDDIMMCGIIDAKDNPYLVVAALTDAASVGLTNNDALCQYLHTMHLDGDLPFDVPVARGVSRMRKGGRAVVYNGFPGMLLAVEYDQDDLWPSEEWIDSLAKSLGSLHGIAIDALDQAKLPSLSVSAARRRLLSTLDEAMASGRVPSVLAAHWESQLEDVNLWHFTPTPIHANLSVASLFGKDGTITAITDWGEAQIGDPAEDIAAIIPGMDATMRESFFKTYRLVRRSSVDARLEERADLLSEFALLKWLLHGLKKKDSVIIDDAVAMLEDLAAGIEDDERAARAESEARRVEAEKDIQRRAVGHTSARESVWDQEEIATQAIDLSDLDPEDPKQSK